ncbi:hypothetical protein [Gemmatimonas sp.]|uniref:hypothetical protein n=1 Tax=Gemmatimonas sp. TaxID=1962908 RepID=UPI00286D9A08|nr:hypothetical protein [Gemmatimonas sp.]
MVSVHRRVPQSAPYGAARMKAVGWLSVMPLAANNARVAESNPSKRTRAAGIGVPATARKVSATLRGATL